VEEVERSISAVDKGGAPLVRFKRVSKLFGAFRALSDISLDIRRGEFLTLLGPSGSGKTTTLMLLAGFDFPTAGSIEMEERRIEALPAHKRDIGVVFQNYALFPHMTAAQNLAFPLSVRGMDKGAIAGEVEKALAMVHMQGLGGRKPAELSGGQQQRVALARALIFKPRLILLDEPLGALDKNLREHMQGELKQLHRQLGTTMVFVTHDQSEALNLSDRIAVFNQGRLEQVDTPEQLYDRPLTAFVASFIGENNLLDGTVESAAESGASVRLDGGALLNAASTGPCSKGERVTVGVRPENVELAEPGSDGAIASVVTDVAYLGEARRITVEATGVGRLSLKTGTGEGSRRIGRGDRIGVILPAAQCRILPANGGEGRQAGEGINHNQAK
jgi:putative spermidine/putrescine transport system ATP-binding protein